MLGSERVLVFLLLLGKKRVAAMSNNRKRDARNNSIIRTKLDAMFCLVMITITEEGAMELDSRGCNGKLCIVVHRKLGVRLAKSCEIYGKFPSLNCELTMRYDRIMTQINTK